MSKQPPSPWSRAFAVAGLELALCRVTDVVPAWDDWVGALAWAGLSGAFLAWADKRSPVVRTALDWAWVCAQLALVSLPHHQAMALPWEFSLLLVPVLLAIGWVRARNELGPLSTRGYVLGFALLTLPMAAPLASLQQASVDLVALVPAATVLALAAALDRRAAFLGLVALFPGTRDAWTATGPVPTGPDIVLISVDTLRYDAAGTMKAFEGMIPAQAPAPWTLPSMSSLLTGVQPGRHGALVDARGAPSPMQDDVRTLAQRFSEAGWDTAASLENPFVKPVWGFGRGIARQRYDGDHLKLPRAFGSGHAHPTGEMVLSALGLLPARPVAVGERMADLADFFAERRDRPLFVWVHVLDAHLPYRHALGASALSWSDRLRLLRGNRQREGEAPGEAFLAAARVGYAHEVAAIDEAIVAALAALPPSPNGRVVVLTADHGEEFGEHEGWEHGHSLYQTLLRVPLRVDGIELAPGPVTLMDVAPTLLAVAGLPADGMEGVDLRQPRPADRPLPSANLLYGDYTMRAVLVGDDKLIRGKRGDRAYDLAVDPGEQHPSSDATLAPLLPDWKPRGPGATLDEATRRQLIELGYQTP